MGMRNAPPKRRKHVLTRLRQRVDSRRCRWVTLCRAVDLSLVVHKDLGGGRALAWITYRNRQVYVIWDTEREELVTVLGEDYAAVTKWQEELATRAAS